MSTGQNTVNTHTHTRARADTRAHKRKRTHAYAHVRTAEERPDANPKKKRYTSFKLEEEVIRVVGGSKVPTSAQGSPRTYII